MGGRDGSKAREEKRKRPKTNYCAQFNGRMDA